MNVTPQTVYVVAAGISAATFIYAAWSWYRASKSSDPDASKAKNTALLMLAISAVALAFFVWLLMKMRKGSESGETTEGLGLF
jgi:uncharacterized membrane protein YidH (DUF202 family)